MSFGPHLGYCCTLRMHMSSDCSAWVLRRSRKLSRRGNEEQSQTMTRPAATCERFLEMWMMQ